MAPTPTLFPGPNARHSFRIMEGSSVNTFQYFWSADLEIMVSLSALEEGKVIFLRRMSSSVGMTRAGLGGWARRMGQDFLQPREEKSAKGFRPRPALSNLLGPAQATCPGIHSHTKVPDLPRWEGCKSLPGKGLRCRTSQGKSDMPIPSAREQSIEVDT